MKSVENRPFKRMLIASRNAAETIRERKSMTRYLKISLRNVSYDLRPCLHQQRKLRLHEVEVKGSGWTSRTDPVVILSDRRRRQSLCGSAPEQARSEENSRISIQRPMTMTLHSIVGQLGRREGSKDRGLRDAPIRKIYLT